MHSNQLHSFPNSSHEALKWSHKKFTHEFILWWNDQDSISFIAQYYFKLESADSDLFLLIASCMGHALFRQKPQALHGTSENNQRMRLKKAEKGHGAEWCWTVLQIGPLQIMRPSFECTDDGLYWINISAAIVSGSESLLRINTERVLQLDTWMTGGTQSP